MKFFIIIVLFYEVFFRQFVNDLMEFFIISSGGKFDHNLGPWRINVFTNLLVSLFFARVGLIVGEYYAREFQHL